MVHDAWVVGDAYEEYVGRWSRRVGVAFLRWLGLPLGQRWLDVGCGTGALTEAVLAEADPAQVVGVDPSAGFLATAQDRTSDARAIFSVGDARALPSADRLFDVVVSGLVLNFVPDPAAAVAEQTRVAKPGGVVAAYVWDYAEGMSMMRHFWDAAADLDPSARDLDEGKRFPLCRPDALRELWTGGGLDEVSVRAIDVPTTFASFDDYWHPFLGGQGPAPGYVMSLTDERRHALRDLLRARLQPDADGAIRLTARAWAVRGRSPAGESA
ncbi:MAG TPA: methyltransferase domain-containing protein [Nocardioidaceae bacterium]|nr:methyltransferase domain-containing protein [Nocardioidaceae bacterium]